MKKLYMDRTELKSCVSIFVKDAEVINAGTTVNAMPVKHKNAEYDRFASEYGIHFIFEDIVPHINFYSVPQIDVFATDGKGGLLGSVGETTDPRGEAPIVFIDDNEEVYLVASTFKELVTTATDWMKHLQPYEGITFYGSKADAERALEFIEPMVSDDYS